MPNLGDDSKKPVNSMTLEEMKVGKFGFTCFSEQYISGVHFLINDTSSVSFQLQPKDKEFGKLPTLSAKALPNASSICHEATRSSCDGSTSENISRFISDCERLYFHIRAYPICPLNDSFSSGDPIYCNGSGQKLFLKRNSNPFIAALSAEGIVPKLVWTKRIETGEVVTAQHWKNGRELTSSEMSQRRVAELLKKIHGSKPLLNMLKNC